MTKRRKTGMTRRVAGHTGDFVPWPDGLRAEDKPRTDDEARSWLRVHYGAVPTPYPGLSLAATGRRVFARERTLWVRANGLSYWDVDTYDGAPEPESRQARRAEARASGKWKPYAGPPPGPWAPQRR